MFEYGNAENACTSPSTIFAVAEDLAPDRMREQMRAQPFGEIRAFLQLEDARVVNDARADIAALQRNDPAPPAVTHEVVRRPRARRAAGIRVIRKPLAPIVAVPVFHAGEARPDRIDRMLRVLPEMPELAPEHRRASARIDDPARADRLLAASP